MQGCGYVQYAMQADMQRALQGLNGREIGGRPVNVRIVEQTAWRLINGFGSSVDCALVQGGSGT